MIKKYIKFTEKKKMTPGTPAMLEVNLASIRSALVLISFCLCLQQINSGELQQ